MTPAELQSKVILEVRPALQALGRKVYEKGGPLPDLNVEREAFCRVAVVFDASPVTALGPNAPVRHTGTLVVWAVQRENTGTVYLNAVHQALVDCARQSIIPGGRLGPGVTARDKSDAGWHITLFTLPFYADQFY